MKRETGETNSNTQAHSFDTDQCFSLGGQTCVLLCRLEPAATDPLLSSGSDTERLDDSGDKAGVANKAKVHPGRSAGGLGFQPGKYGTSIGCS